MFKIFSKNSAIYFFNLSTVPKISSQRHLIQFIVINFQKMGKSRMEEDVFPNNSQEKTSQPQENVANLESTQDFKKIRDEEEENCKGRFEEESNN